jgi:5-methylcytosine-specific restriction endonuclease McrA
MTTAAKRRKRNALGWRYGWTCWLCGEVIDPALGAGDPMRATIHHHRKMARGGGNGLSNLRLAHAHCHDVFHRGGWPAIENERGKRGNDR